MIDVHCHLLPEVDDGSQDAEMTLEMARMAWDNGTEVIIATPHCNIPGTPPNMLMPPKGDAFSVRNRFALQIDFEEEPPFFRLSDTHLAATWLLHPKAPKVEMPQELRERIARMKEDALNAAEQ